MSDPLEITTEDAATAREWESLDLHNYLKSITYLRVLGKRCHMHLNANLRQQLEMMHGISIPKLVEVDK